MRAYVPVDASVCVCIFFCLFSSARVSLCERSSVCARKFVCVCLSEGVCVRLVVVDQKAILAKQNSVLKHKKYRI